MTGTQLALTQQPEPEPNTSDENPQSSTSTGSKYNVEYIKNYWSRDCYIFDLRWLKNNCSRQDIFECVQNNCFPNAGHSSFLLPLIKSQGWDDEQITDYIMTLRARHLLTLKSYAEAELDKINFEFMDTERIMELFNHYSLYCTTLQQNPLPVKMIFEKAKNNHRETLKKEKQKLNEKILKIAEKIKQFEKLMSETTPSNNQQ